MNVQLPCEERIRIAAQAVKTPHYYRIIAVQQFEEFDTPSRWKDFSHILQSSTFMLTGHNRNHTLYTSADMEHPAKYFVLLITESGCSSGRPYFYPVKATRQTLMAAAMSGQHLVQMWPSCPHVRTSS
jgi:hypothetical protein